MKNIAGCLAADQMPEPPQISAVIPTYNRGRLVGRAIESVLAQERPPREVIVVDDGSTDDTRTVVESFGDPVRYLRQQNAGAAVARNAGVREAKSGWIAFLDSDDCWSPAHLRRIADCILATEGKALLYFDDTRLPESEGARTFWEMCGLRLEHEYEIRTDASEWAFMLPQPMMLQASVVSRDGYWRYGGLCEQLRTREDTLFFYQVALNATVCAVAGCGALMNSDDAIRLSKTHDDESQMKASCYLYGKLLGSLEPRAEVHRETIRRLLGMSHFGLGRTLYRRGDYAGTVRHLLASVWHGRTSFVRDCVEPWARRQWWAAGSGARQ